MLIDHQVRLLHDKLDIVGISSGRAWLEDIEDHFLDHLRLLHAGIPRHLDAVAFMSREAHAEEVLIEIQSELFLNPFFVVTKAAGGDQGGIAQEMIALLAIRADGADAADLAVFRFQTAGRGFQVELHAQFAGPSFQMIGHGLRLTAADHTRFRFDNVPGRIGFFKITRGFFKFDAH